MVVACSQQMAIFLMCDVVVVMTGWWRWGVGALGRTQVGRFRGAVDPTTLTPPAPYAILSADQLK